MRDNHRKMLFLRFDDHGVNDGDNNDHAATLAYAEDVEREGRGFGD